MRKRWKRSESDGKGNERVIGGNLKERVGRARMW